MASGSDITLHDRFLIDLHTWERTNYEYHLAY